MFCYLILFVLLGLLLSDAKSKSVRPAGSRYATKGGPRKRSVRGARKPQSRVSEEGSATKVDTIDASFSDSKKGTLVPKLPMVLGGAITVGGLGALVVQGLKMFQKYRGSQIGGPGTGSKSDSLFKTKAAGAQAGPLSKNKEVLKIDPHQDFGQILAAEADAVRVNIYYI